MTELQLLYIIPLKGESILANKMRQNITLDPDVYDEFCKYAGKKGIKVSTWVNIKMKEFIEEEKLIEKLRKEHSI